MKRNKSNYIRVLQAVCDSKLRLAETFRTKGDDLSATSYLNEAVAVQMAIRVISEPEYFDFMVKNYNLEDNANEIESN